MLLSSASRSVQMERLFSILIESGMAYCALWVRHIPQRQSLLSFVTVFVAPGGDISDYRIYTGLGKFFYRRKRHDGQLHEGGEGFSRGRPGTSHCTLGTLYDMYYS